MFTDIASHVWALLARYLFPTSDYYQPAQYYPYGVPFRPRFRLNGTHGSTRRRNRHQPSA